MFPVCIELPVRRSITLIFIENLFVRKSTPRVKIDQVSIIFIYLNRKFHRGGVFFRGSRKACPCFPALRDLSFIEIVRVRSATIRVISHYKRKTRSRKGEKGDGPLRDTDTNRDINTKHSFIFFYVPTRTRRPPRRILTRTSSTSLWKFLSLSSSFFSSFFFYSSILPTPSFVRLRSSLVRTPLRLVAPTVSLHDLHSVDAARAMENFMTASCFLYIPADPRFQNWSRFCKVYAIAEDVQRRGQPTGRLGRWNFSNFVRDKIYYIFASFRD